LGLNALKRKCDKKVLTPLVILIQTFMKLVPY